MRATVFVGLAVLLVATHARAADPTAYRAVVSDAEVKLRAGPSDAFPDTDTLTKGSAVVVEREEGNGWLAVTAPYGSVSWVATQFIEDPAPDRPTPKNVLVHVEDEVTLAAGKAGDAATARHPPREGAQRQYSPTARAEGHVRGEDVVPGRAARGRCALPAEDRGAVRPAREQRLQRCA